MKWLSRKFLITLGVLICTVILKVLNIINDTSFTTVVVSVTGSYLAANSVSKKLS